MNMFKLQAESNEEYGREGGECYMGSCQAFCSPLYERSF